MGSRKSLSRDIMQVFLSCSCWMHTPSQYFPELLNTVAVSFLTSGFILTLKSPCELCTSTFQAFREWFFPKGSRSSSTAFSFFPLGWTSSAARIPLWGMQFNRQGKYRAVPESPVLKTLLATSVMAGGNRVGERQKSFYVCTPPPPGPPCCSWCLH